MKLLIINYMIGIVAGASPILIVYLWPEKCLGFLGKVIGICLDYMQTE